MSFNPIAQGLALGYTAQQILKFVSRSFPSISPRIKKAQQAGHSAEEVLKFIGKSMEGSEYSPAMSQSQIHGMNEKRQEAFTKGALKLAAGSFAIPAIARSSVGQGILQQIGLNPRGPNPSATSSLNSSQSQSARSQIPFQVNGAQLPTDESSPLEKKIEPISQNTETQKQTDLLPAPSPISPTTPSASPNIVDSESIIKQMGLEEKVNNLLKAGNDPKNISSFVDQLLAPSQKKWLGEQIKLGKAKTMEEMVQDYIQNQKATSPESSEQPAPIKIEKGSLVSIPSGLEGHVESIRNGQVLIKDSDGRLHKSKQEDLIESPIPEKDLADLHDELIKAIEKNTGEDISRMVNFAGYDPKTNTLAFLPHIGALYTYEDITPEDAKLLTSILSTRKTSGENFIGAWKKGSKSPIGAAMSALIQKLQKQAGGKGKEYSQKFETLYNALEPARIAAKNKKKKKK